jgi:predicted ArsR family transcriptional regulator
MRLRLRLLTAVLLAAAGAPALAADDAAAAWTAAQRASAAQQALSDRYTAIWSTLDAAQKSRFAAQERAWLNDGRALEQQACIARASAPTELVARTCEAAVFERHLGAVAAPQRVASSN